MNKQQLASKIWESANKMRSKIEANEYKQFGANSEKNKKIPKISSASENALAALQAAIAFWVIWTKTIVIRGTME